MREPEVAAAGRAEPGATLLTSRADVMTAAGLPDLGQPEPAAMRKIREEGYRVPAEFCERRRYAVTVVHKPGIYLEQLVITQAAKLRAAAQRRRGCRQP